MSKLAAVPWLRACEFNDLEVRISDLDKPVAIHILEKDVGKILLQATHPMNKTAQIINSILAFVMLACLTSHAMAGKSITHEKVSQIRPGQTTEEDLVRAFGPPTTKTVCPPGEMTLDWFYSSPISAQNYIPIIGPALGGTHVRVWELWVVVGANGEVKRYIAYAHYMNGETKRYIERGYYPTETGKNIQVGRPTDFSRSHGRNQAYSEVAQGGW